MKIKSRLGDPDTDRTEAYQIKSTRSAFDFRRVSSIVRVFSVSYLKVNSFGYIILRKKLVRCFGRV